MGNIIEYVKPEKHTLYMSCAQYADWIPRNIDENVEEAYIVQEVVLEQIIDEIKSVVHYFEAWKIENGICKKEYLQDSDDLFCIGHPLDDGDALRDSIGHEGSVIFSPKVFLVKKESKLYTTITEWPIDMVREANGLHAVYYTDEISKMFKNRRAYHRDIFRHDWVFTNPEEIFTTVLHYCKTMYHPSNKTDRCNFNMTINEFFPDDVYEDLKQRVIEAWDCE